jgi:thiamine-phosphate pyrophosphorylase
LKFILPKIYPITDRELAGLSHTEQTNRLIDGGAHLIQLREKSGNMLAFCQDAKQAVRTAKSRGVLILINDRVDIAMMSDADGVHLGQDDFPPAEARRLLGPEAIIGFSTHNLEQAVAAVRLPINYIAIGPVFATATKKDTEPVIGPDGLREVRRAIGDFPLVAIGGISSDKLETVFEAGADSAAMISEFYSDKDATSSRFRLLSGRGYDKRC